MREIWLENFMLMLLGKPLKNIRKLFLKLVQLKIRICNKGCFLIAFQKKIVRLIKKIKIL